MRRGFAIISVVLLGAGVAGVLLPATALSQEGNSLTVTVDKVVVGTAPSGTQFTVHWDCNSGDFSGDIVFGETGTPIPPGSNVVSPGTSAVTCTFSETGTGGADTVAFACSANAEATCDDDHTVTNGGVGVAMITVTNTYAAAAAAPAVAITAAPRTTG